MTAVDITATASKPLSYPIEEVWAAQVDATILPPTFKLKAASASSLEVIGSSVVAFSPFSGTVRAETTSSDPPTMHMLDCRWPKLMYLFGWLLGPSYVSRVDFVEASDGRTVVTASTTVRFRPILTAIFLALLIVFFYLLAMVTNAPPDQGGPPLPWWPLVLADLMLPLPFLWSLLLLGVWATAKSGSKNAVRRLRRGLCRAATARPADCSFD